MQKRILIRIDDVCPTMDYSKFMDRINFFKKLGIKPMLGVIPCCEDAELRYGQIDNFWEMIRDFADLGYPIAMHGYRHKYTSRKRGLVCTRRMSEFSGLSYEEQCMMLQRGKKILETNGVCAEWFMAPGHSYDRVTIRALRAAGFHYVSDGRSSRTYQLDGILCVPATSIWQSPFNGQIVTICLHPNTDSVRSYQKVQNFVQQNVKLVSSFSDVENWTRQPYAIARIDEIVRIVMEKVAVCIYTKIKEILSKSRKEHA